MSVETAKEMVEWLKGFRRDSVTITFHGGEPLLAGAKYYKEVLPLIADGLGDQGVAFAMQSNLWLMTPELAKTLAKYDIPIGSSLDGPEELNDSQRGKGYFGRTMRGYQIAKKNGLKVSFICTFTGRSAKLLDDIFDFYLSNGFNLKFHPALPSLRDHKRDEFALEPDEYGDLLVSLLDKYMENKDLIEVMNIDHLCKCVFTGRGSVCTFVDCMDSTYAVGPDGSIYPCYRFVGMEKYVMGNVRDRPTLADLQKSYAGKLMQQYKKHVDKTCKDCSHIKYCRGGCPYNAIVPGGGKIAGVDPHCPAYKRIFTEIGDRMNEQMFGGPDLESATFMANPMDPSRAGIMSIMLKKIKDDF
jgi:putative peptide-modifying radical SAM enzyme, Mhun_1560 family